jgi:small neutral amino acid transporter SnatA (MarC family)
VVTLAEIGIPLPAGPGTFAVTISANAPGATEAFTFTSGSLLIMSANACMTVNNVSLA